MMSKERKTLTVSVLKETPDDNWRGWDEETFYLREHLYELIKVYGIDVMKEELNECEWLLNKLNQNKDDYSFERVSTEERQRERSDKYDYLIGDDDDIKLNQNKPLPPPPPKDREIHISGKSRHKR